jgi:RNA polymerase sigma factor (sigma-70 family)
MASSDAPVPLAELLAHREWVQRIARSLARDDAEADDLSQEAWVEAIEHPPPHAQSPRGWFAGLLRHRMLNRRRGERRRAVRESGASRPERAADVADVVVYAEMHREVVDAVLALDEPYRTTVLLRYFEDLAPREIARRQGVPVETVRSRVQRGIEMLRRRLLAMRRRRDAAWALPLLECARSERRVTRPDRTLFAETAADAARGGIVGSAFTKLAAGAVVLLLVVGGMWLARDETEKVVAATPPPDAAVLPRVSRHALRAPSETAPPVASPESDDADAFAGVDRDLDLHGRVVDSTGRPVSGALVRVICRPLRNFGMYLGWQNEWKEEAGKSGRTDARGRFALRLRAGEVVDLAVSAEGFASRTRTRVAAGERVTVTLDAGVCLVVQVQSESGTPVAGARVEATGSIGGYSVDAMQSIATTGADGRCRIPALPPDRQLVLLTTREDFVPGETSPPKLPASGEASVTVVLQSGRLVTGRVLDAATGHAVVPAEIDLTWCQRTAVGADGTFRVHVSDTEPRFTVRAPGHVPENVELGTRTDVEVRLRPGIVVSGRVVDAANAPVADAYVIAKLDFTGETGLGRTSSDGRFRLDTIPSAKTVAFAVSAPGHGRILLDARMPESGGFDLGDVVLPAARAIAGTVLDVEGRPAPNIEMELRGVNASRSKPRFPADWPVPNAPFCPTRRTDDLGRFRFTDLSAGEWRIEAKVMGPNDAIVQMVRLGADADVTDLVLSARPARFTAHVLDEQGRPVRGAVVCVGNGSVQLDLVTDGAGVASADLRGEEIHASVREAAQDGRALRIISRPKIQKGVHEVQFVVREDAWISGRLVDRDDRPLRGELVALGPDARSVGNAYSDENGAFRLVVPPRASWDVVFVRPIQRGDAEAFCGGVAAVPAGSENVVVRVCPDAGTTSLSLVVRDADGKAAAGVPISLGHGNVSLSGTTLSGTTDAEGRIAWRTVPARWGQFHVGGWGEPDPAWRTEGRLEPSGWLQVFPHGQEVVVTLRRARAASGRVELPAAWTDATIAINASSVDGHVACAFARKDLTFSIPLPVDEPGPFRLTVSIYRQDAKPTGELAGVRPGDMGLVLVVRER